MGHQPAPTVRACCTPSTDVPPLRNGTGFRNKRNWQEAVGGVRRQCHKRTNSDVNTFLVLDISLHHETGHLLAMGRLSKILAIGNSLK
ncbi:hypothetical protein NPIL_630081 [Nephila pilipes]|uniref:Uncharacterized protein n=1 Tax=Nephila pilipes TaxID=299642 RepID=A0A8X6UTS9_NEPPI|nr:hypothetical protein NPIL_630081 [Nephila pilipes]